VATSNWSAGSRWKGCGSWVDSTMMCGWRCRSDTPGSASAPSLQSPTARSSFKPSVLHKFRDFPTGDDTNAEGAVSAKFEKFAVPRLQPIRSRNPPNPNVGVQQNHCRASQSSLATGSNGSRNSRTEPRRLRPPAIVGAVVFDTTNTSTDWPGSNGRPSKTSSPCSPTVVSLQCACTPSV
jgi:hypothetical protein